MNPFLHFGQASGLILSFAKAISFHEIVVFLPQRLAQVKLSFVEVNGLVLRSQDPIMPHSNKAFRQDVQAKSSKKLICI
jgi:hypothetical protein